MLNKLMITGVGGFVAGNVVLQAIDEWEVHGLARKPIYPPMKNFNFHTIDLRDLAKLRAVFSQVRPDAVIHAAAIADIDFCQSNQQIAEEVNVGITRELSLLCAESGARLVFCSTDTVFDGEKGLYVEEDLPIPVNYYAETKIRAENIIQDSNKNAAIARLALVMGLPVLVGGNSFLAKMRQQLDAGKTGTFYENEIRTPIDVVTLSRALLELAANDFTGILHLAGNDRLNRYDMAQRIAAQLNYSLENIKSADSSSIPGRAPRPRDVSLNNDKARNTLHTPMVNLQQGLVLAMSSRRIKNYDNSPN
ncbi:SDR family oxidoreductase [candidate division KSB1 bacterium]|nr:SDR family oxidoreductase [candidate division KSB1 bacterium]